MDEATRLEYLKALGVDVWQPIIHTAEQAPGAEFVGADATELLSPAPAKHDMDAWQALQDEVAGCQRCELCKTRTQTVFGSGNPHADWMLIGEAPGQSEDQQGKPFVGKAGLLLTEMLRAMGLQREQVFIANILKCRPPNNRDPSAQEAAACAEYLQRQITAVQPKIILAVGRIAAQYLLKTDMSLGKLRGSVHHYQDTPLVVIYHPAYLLRSLLEKRKAWGDLQLAMRVYRERGQQAT